MPGHHFLRIGMWPCFPDFIPNQNCISVIEILNLPPTAQQNSANQIKQNCNKEDFILHNYMLLGYNKKRL